MPKAEDTIGDLIGLPHAGAAQAEWMALDPDLQVKDYDEVRPDPRSMSARHSTRWVWKRRLSDASGDPASSAAASGGFRGRNAIGVVVVGSGALAESIVAELLRAPSPYRLIGHLKKQQTEDDPTAPHADFQEFEPFERLEKIAARDRIQCIVVAMSEQRGDLPVEQLLACRMQGVRIEEGVGFYEKVGRKIPLAGLKPSYLIFNGGFEWPSRAAKRGLDLLLSSAGLLVTAPLFLLLPLLIKLTSPGPVFYRQDRVGLDGHRFKILKFRSMFDNAEEQGAAVWAGESDPRITPLGRLMRQFRLDELPQMLNVLRGDMSFVGPRPERPEFIAPLCREIPYYALRLSVKPGITGWAQVMFRYGASVQDAAEKLQYDLYYIKHMSLTLDGRITLKTIKTVLFQSGAR